MRNKRKLTLIGLIFIIIVASGFIFRPKQNVEPIVNLSVTSTNPKNNQEIINLPSEIQINFNSIVDNTLKDNLEIINDPEFEKDIKFLGNQLTIKPKEQFKLDTTYNTLIKYEGKEIYSLTFRTFPLSYNDFREQTELQTQGDLDFTDAYKDFLTDHPWYHKFPIENEKYRIIYDLEIKKFRIRILINATSEDEKNTLINEAVEKIKQAGVKEPFEYYTLDN